MKKLIHVNPEQMGRLRCDAVGCGFVEPEPLPFGEHLIGRPCPECGENLLTRRDYAKSVKLLAMVDRINRIGAFFGLGTEEPPPTATTVRVRHAKGEWHVNLVDKETKP